MTHVMIKHAYALVHFQNRSVTDLVGEGGHSSLVLWRKAAGNLKVDLYIYNFSKKTLYTHILDQILTKNESYMIFL